MQKVMGTYSLECVEVSFYELRLVPIVGNRAKEGI